jgi:hypothetical protein
MEEDEGRSIVHVMMRGGGIYMYKKPCDAKSKKVWSSGQLFLAC